MEAADSHLINQDIIIKKLEREKEAFDRLYNEAESDVRRLRIKNIYYGRYFRILREYKAL